MPNFHEGFRAAGLLLHPSSLHSPFGIGDFGPAAYQMIGFLKKAGFHYWQVLPMSHTSPGLSNSPYSAFSAFAGDPLLISPEIMVEDGWLTESELTQAKISSGNFVDFPKVYTLKNLLYNFAFERAEHGLLNHEGFHYFLQENATWLNDYALFVAAKELFKGQSWIAWPDDLKFRYESALQKYGTELARPILAIKFQQYLFHEQLQKLKRALAAENINLIGDVAIYVNHDSADVWANQHLFYLNEKGEASVVAGVPPDYFSATGQLWGNPLFHWERHRQENFGWWLGRMKRALELCSWVRLDHFRAFAAYWEVQAGSLTAQDGLWRPGPGADLFNAFARHGFLNIIAEDLGIITPDVTALRRKFSLPGMRILQFAFGDSQGVTNHAPFRIEPDNVVYTGTHDNNTSRGWFRQDASDLEKKQLAELCGFQVTEENAAWALIRLAWLSAGGLAVCPLQDVLNLDERARMNMPGTVDNNWSWKMGPQDILSEKLAARLSALGEISGRDNLEHPNILTY